MGTIVSPLSSPAPRQTPIETSSVAYDDLLNDTELNECIDALRRCRLVLVEAYVGSIEAKREPLRLCRPIFIAYSKKVQETSR